MTNGTESESHAPQSPRCLAAGLLLAASLVFASGCTSQSKIVPTDSKASDGPVFRSRRVGLFNSLIEKQKTSPDTSVQSYAPADSELSGRLAPMTEKEIAVADQPLQKVLETIPAPSLPKPAAVLSVPTDSDRIDAVSKYLSGREKLADGKFADALDDLVAATRLDPVSPEPHRALADANLALGRTSAAMRSFRDAAARGSDEPRLCWILGRDALKSGSTAEAASFLKVARENIRNGPAGADRGLLTLVECDLAEALGSSGYLLAMVELRTPALERLTEITPSQSIRAEFGELFRRAGELYLSNGDALTRLGKFSEAAKQYATAESTGLIDQSATTARWFTTLLRQGRSAEVADRLLAEAFERPERLPAARLAMIPVLARSQAGPGLRIGFAELLSQPRPASVSSLLSRATAAAAESPRESREILADGLVRFTPDPDTLAAYLAQWPVTAVSERVSGIKLLVTRRPAETGRFAQALIAEGHDPALVESQLSGDQSVSSQLLLTHLLSGWGNLESASSRSKAIPASSEPALTIATLAARGELAAQSGDWALADLCIEGLASQPTDESCTAKLAQSNILRSLQRYSQAWAVLETAAGQAPTDAATDRPKIEILLRGAELVARTGKPDVANALLRRVAAADPHDDRSYGGMASIISASGNVDQQKLAAIVREVRENCPAGRSMRGLLVQQSLATETSIDSAAVKRLIALVQQMPHDASLIDQLASFVERNSATTPKAIPAVKDVLAGMLTDRPGSQSIRYALARVQAAGASPQEAISTLDNLPPPMRDVQSLRLKEKILRDDLKKPDEAKALESQRLATYQPGINAAIESADQFWRDNKQDEAVQRLQKAIAPAAELDTDQQAKILFMANRSMSTMARLPDEPRQGKSEDGLRAIALFDCVALHGGKLLPQHHQSRLILLGVNFPDDFPRLLAAANLAGDQLPTLKVASIRLAADAVANDVPRRGNEFLQYALSKMTDMPAPLITLVIRRAVTFGTLEDIQKALDLAEEPARVGAVLADLDATPEDNTTIAQKQAELCYAVASGLTAGNEEAKAEVIYRRALARDPEHGLTNNDLGYALLEKGELDKAAPLIETAAKVLKNRSHVIDSLGWLRYKQGKVKDTPATATTPIEEGAITILQHALQLANGNEAAMLDHLGDAQWAAGEYSKAVESWGKAKYAAQQMLIEIRATSATRESFVAELKTILASTDRKVAAYRAKKEPEIAAWPGRKEPGTPLAGQEEK